MPISNVTPARPVRADINIENNIHHGQKLQMAGVFSTQRLPHLDLKNKRFWSRRWRDAEKETAALRWAILGVTHLSAGSGGRWDTNHGYGSKKIKIDSLSDV